MAPHCDGVEFRAAVDIIFNGKQTPNGLTEALLADARREYKARFSA